MQHISSIPISGASKRDGPESTLGSMRNWPPMQAAVQRATAAGHMRAGQCFRLCTEEAYQQLPQQTVSLYYLCHRRMVLRCHIECRLTDRWSQQHLRLQTYIYVLQAS